jgi:hypothetical protein
MVLADGTSTHVTVDAKFDGRDYPVNCSTIDTIAYVRRDDRRISGTAKKSGKIVFIETVSVSSDRKTLTMAYVIRGGEDRLTSSVAVFTRETDKR